MCILSHKSITLGTDLSPVNNSLSSFGIISRRVFDYAILDIRDISRAIEILQARGVRFTSLYAHITPRKPYYFNNKEKGPLTAAAIIYDFVDGFVVSDFGTNIAKMVDPLLNLRLINDEYRDIYLEVPEHYGTRDMDKLLNYVHYSNIDGLLLNTEQQFNYIMESGPGNLRLYVNNVNAPKKYDELIGKGAKAVFIKAKGKLAPLYFMEGIRLRLGSKL